MWTMFFFSVNETTYENNNISHTSSQFNLNTDKKCWQNMHRYHYPIKYLLFFTEFQLFKVRFTKIKFWSRTGIEILNKISAVTQILRNYLAGNTGIYLQIKIKQKGYRWKHFQLLRKNACNLGFSAKLTSNYAQLYT